VLFLNSYKKLNLCTKFRSSGVQKFRSSGVQKFRSSGVQEFRSSEVQEFRSSGGRDVALLRLYEFRS
jgi:hypothetical protein